MKRNRILIVIGILLCGSYAAIVSAHQDEAEPARQYWRRVDFMTQKRLYSQIVMEGFMTEQKETITYYGTKMWNTSDDPLWSDLFKEAFKDPVFKEKAKTFRDNIKDMLDAMGKRDPDKAMIAYGKSLQSCYDCHKYVRASAHSRF